MQKAQTIIKELDVRRYPLIWWSKHWSLVFQEVPLRPIFLLFFFPPAPKVNKIKDNTSSVKGKVLPVHTKEGYRGEEV